MIIEKSKFPNLWDAFVEVALDNGTCRRDITSVNLPDTSEEEAVAAESMLAGMTLRERIILIEGPTGEQNDLYDHLLACNISRCLIVDILNQFFDSDSPMMGA